MPLNKDEKEKIVSKFGENNTDTGSSSVQIALLTSRIRQLTEHVTNNKKDNHSRRGLLNLVGLRRRLLSYLKRKNYEEYIRVSKELKLKVAQ